MRLFFALPLPEDARGVLGRWMEGHPEVRWAPVERLHLTLAFLGEVRAELAGRTEDVAARVASRHAPLHLVAARLGAFPRPQGAQLVFLDLLPHPGLAALAAELRAGLRDEGVPFDPKPFRPHLTLARPRHHRPLPPPPALAWRADRLLLLDSHLERGGARHEILGSWDFGPE